MSKARWFGRGRDARDKAQEAAQRDRLKRRTRALAIAVEPLETRLLYSHFRGAAMVPSVSSTGLLTVTTTSFWAKNSATTPAPLVPGVGTPRFVSGTVDNSDTRFTKRVDTHEIQLRAAGTYHIDWDSCCRIGGIRNAAEGNWAMDSDIYWNGSSANTPITFNFSSIQPEVVRGRAYRQNLGVLGAPGLTMSYDQNLNTAINSQA